MYEYYLPFFLGIIHFSGNLYGTSRKVVNDVQSNGKVCILDIDLQGVQQVKKSDLQAHYVFIRPPSIEVCQFLLFIQE